MKYFVSHGAFLLLLSALLCLIPTTVSSQASTESNITSSEHSNDLPMSIRAEPLNDTHARLVVFNCTSSYLGLLQKIHRETSGSNFDLVRALLMLPVDSILALLGTILPLEPLADNATYFSPTTTTSSPATFTPTPSVGTSTSSSAEIGSSSSDDAATETPLEPHGILSDIVATAIVPYCVQEVRGCISPHAEYSAYLGDIPGVFVAGVGDSLSSGHNTSSHTASDGENSPPGHGANGEHEAPSPAFGHQDPITGENHASTLSFVAPQPDVGLQLLEVHEVTSSSARIHLEFSRPDLDIDTIVERQVELTAYDDFQPSSPLESVTLQHIGVHQAPQSGRSGITVNVTLHGLQPFSHFQITFVCKLRKAETGAVFLAYLTTPGSRPPPPVIIQAPEGLITKDTLLLRSDPPAVTVGILDHVIVEIHDTITNNTAFEIFTNGYSMATCLGRYDPYPTISVYMQSLNPYTTYRFRVRFAVDPTSLNVKQPSQNDEGGWPAFSPFEDGHGLHRRRREASDDLFLNQLPSSCLTHIAEQREVTARQSTEHTADSDGHRDRRSEGFPQDDGSYIISKPFPTVIFSHVLSNWSHTLEVTTKPSTQMRPRPIIVYLNESHIEIDVEPQRLLAPVMVGLQVTYLDINNDTLATHLFPSEIMKVTLPYAWRFQNGARYFILQLINSEGISLPSYAQRLPAPTQGTTRTGGSRDLPRWTLSAAIGGAVGLCVIVTLIAVRYTYQYRGMFVFPKADDWEIPRMGVEQGRKLGEGNFGMVHLGTYDDRAVAIKSLQPGASIFEAKQFVGEAKLLKRIWKTGICHDNVVRLIGVMMQSLPLGIVFEYLPNGALDKFLRETHDNEPHLLDATQLLYFANDVGSGMAHLAAQGIVHCDLAARNCLVSDQWVVKIADLGMSRPMPPINYSWSSQLASLRSNVAYYRKNGEFQAAARWTAPEALGHGMYTEMSDAWSFAVVLFEIYTFGKQLPFANVRENQMLEHLKRGHRPKAPVAMPPIIYVLCEQCWSDHRPTFSAICKFLRQLANTLGVPLVDGHDRVHPEERVLRAAEDLKAAKEVLVQVIIDEAAAASSPRDSHDHASASADAACLAILANSEATMRSKVLAQSATSTVPASSAPYSESVGSRYPRLHSCRQRPQIVSSAHNIDFMSFNGTPGTITTTACALDTEFSLVSVSTGDQVDVILKAEEKPDVKDQPQVSGNRRNEARGEAGSAVAVSGATCVAFTV